MQDFFNSIVDWFNQETNILDFNFLNWIWVVILGAIVLILIIIIVLIVAIAKKKKVIKGNNAVSTNSQPVANENKVITTTTNSAVSAETKPTYIPTVLNKKKPSFRDREYALVSESGKQILVTENAVWLVELNGFARKLKPINKVRPNISESILYQISPQKIVTITIEGTSSKKVEDTQITGLLITFITPSLAKIGTEVYKR